MKRVFSYALSLIVLMAVMSFKPIPCGKYQGRNIYKGEKGGCYYLKTKKKIKVYIDKKHCKC